MQKTAGANFGKKFFLFTKFVAIYIKSGIISAQKNYGKSADLQKVKKFNGIVFKSVPMDKKIYKPRRTTL